MSAAFDLAFDIITSPRIEGGYCDVAGDTGGKTNFGIADARDGKLDGMADLDGDGNGDKAIKDLVLGDTKAVYKRDYWDMCKCDQLPWPLALYVFDAAVNQGCNPAVRMLQQVLGCKQDGVIGQITIGRAQKAGHPESEIPAQYMAARATRYFGTRSFDKFGAGWLKRIFMITRIGEIK